MVSMGLFWKRKSGDQFVSLKLNEPALAETRAEDRREEPRASIRAESSVESPAAPAAVLEPAATATGPTPIPYELQKRSEEHTSELQSLAYLVCRLLLEKK